MQERIKRINIAIENFQFFFSGKKISLRTIENVIPTGAEVVSVLASYNGEKVSTISLFYKHESFPLVKYENLLDLPNNILRMAQE